MARKVDYDAKISKIEAQIEKKKTEIKKLKSTLSDLKEQKEKSDYKELMDYMTKNEITASQVLDQIAPKENQQQ